MSALFGNVFLRKEHALVEVRIEVGLHQRVVDVLCPAHEVVYALLRTVGIVDLQAITLGFHIITHGLQTIGSLACEQRRRLFVAVDTGAHKVVRTEVTDFQYGIGHHVGNGHKLTGIVSRTDLLALRRVRKAGHYCHAANCEDGGKHP